MFDSDGTLADTLPWCRSVFNELAVRHGFRRVEEDEHEAYRDLAGRELLRKLGLPLWKLPVVVRSMRAMMKEHVHQFSLFPGVTEMLQRLSQRGVQIGIVSSNSRENVESILGRPNARLVNVYACGASMFGKAPKLRSVLRQTRTSPRAALYVGDELRDGEAAREVGIAFGAVGWGQQRIETLRAQTPEEVFTSVNEITAAVLNGG
jgi:phosphoglycolate phosphatase